MLCDERVSRAAGEWEVGIVPFSSHVVSHHWHLVRCWRTTAQRQCGFTESLRFYSHKATKNTFRLPGSFCSSVPLKYLRTDYLFLNTQTLKPTVFKEQQKKHDPFPLGERGGGLLYHLTGPTGRPRAWKNRTEQNIHLANWSFVPLAPDGGPSGGTDDARFGRWGGFGACGRGGNSATKNMNEMALNFRPTLQILRSRSC